MTSATSVKSSAVKPRVARAGVPIRRPEVTIGGRGSLGTALRLTVMPTSWRRSSACCPSRSEWRRSTRIRCTSVPPERTSTPASRASGAVSRSARIFAPSTVRRWRSLNSSLAATLKETALAAMTCSSGPPWKPGKTEELSFLANSLPRARMMPPRGPPRVLWVVEVTTSAYSTGLGCSPAATRPAKCAMSTHSSAPVSSAIRRNAAKSSCRGYADQPAMITFGRCSLASCSTSSMSTRPESST
ncbi:hypothetical protein SsS58_08734 [Streptomyces scabiei]|uniref:Uncharacterized protein n=1 Tax=Streptomyces scabiei TaxID=1930 RepID=A0A100JZ03_STRSC|nr:hypothetical protein SsS58_08734 [Streptomyces scabiei]